MPLSLQSGFFKLDSNDTVPEAISNPDRIISREQVKYSEEPYDELVTHFVMPLDKIPLNWHLIESKVS